MLKAILLVGTGGAAGSILRYITTVYVQKKFLTQGHWATLTVNILGCLLAGVLIAFLYRNINGSDNIKWLLLTGFCGGYTTFSAFAVENIRLIQSGHVATAAIYILASIILGLLGVFSGMYLVQIFQKIL